MLIPKAVASPHPVQIQLDTPNATFAPGQPITGHLTVTGAHPDNGELLVEVHAFTVGSDGHPGYAQLASQSVYTGPFHPGSTNTFPFHLAAPRCVSRYQGHLFSLETRLVAVTLLDSQHGSRTGVRREPAAWMPIAIAQDARPLSIAPMVGWQLTGNPSSYVGCCSGIGCTGLGAAGLLGIGLTVLLNGVADGLLWVAGAGIVALFCFVLGLSYIFVLLRNTAVYRRIGESRFSVGLTPDGQAVSVEIQLERFKGIVGASAVIRVDERTETLLFIREDTRKQSHKRSHQVALQQIELVPNPAELKLVGLLPRAALSRLPPNVGNNHAKILWHLDLHLQLRGCPDVKGTFPLDAAPGGEPFPVPQISS